jgi:hypothetical protein
VATGGAAGSTGAGGSVDAGLAPCGGLFGRKCTDDTYCDYKPGDCMTPDATGVCRPRPRFCPLVCNGACGCDGKSYCNACEAHNAGFDDTKAAFCPDAAVPP